MNYFCWLTISERFHLRGRIARDNLIKVVRKRILIIDKNGDTKSLLKLLLVNSDKYVLQDDFESFEESRPRLSKSLPAVILLGLELNDMDGIEASRIICESFPSIKVVMITSYETPEIVYEALKAGVFGFISKSFTYQQLMDCLEKIHRDEPPMSGRVARFIIEYFRVNPNSPLTRRERELMTILSFGKNLAETSEALAVSKNTINRHLANIYEKLEVSSRSEALQKVIQEKLI